jgi:chromodomain-helicase-DNA-binding protein 1
MILMTSAFTQELAALGKRANAKVSRKASKKERDNLLNISVSRGRDKKGKAGSQKVNVQMNKERRQKPTKVEPLVKEEGEMSDNEEVYEQFKEVKWMEWCEDVMIDEVKTLERLQRLQTTSANLPKEKVVFSFWFSFYLVLCYYSLELMYSIFFSFRCL